MKDASLSVWLKRHWVRWKPSWKIVICQNLLNLFTQLYLNIIAEHKSTRLCIIYTSFFSTSLVFPFLITEGYSISQSLKCQRKKWSWHLCFDSFIYERNLHKLCSYLIICASLIDYSIKCLYIDTGSNHIKSVFVKDARIFLYWDGLFTCSSHLHWPHSISREKGTYVLTWSRVEDRGLSIS